MKKLLKVLLVLVILFCLVIAGLTIAVRVKFPPEKIRVLAEKESSKAAKRNIRIQSVSFSFFPRVGIRLKGITISNTSRSVENEKKRLLHELLKEHNISPQEALVLLNSKKVDSSENIEIKEGDVVEISRRHFQNKESLLQLGELFVAVEVMPLFQKKVVIKKVLIDKLQLLVETNKRGSFNFDDLMSKGTEKTKEPTKKEPLKLPIALNLNSFEIRHSKIVYNNPKTQQKIVLGEISQELSVHANEDLSEILTKGLIEIKKISIAGKGVPVQKSGVYFMLKHHLKVNLQAGNLNIQDFTLGFQKTNITTKGTVQHFDKDIKNVDLSILTNAIDLKKLLQEVPAGLFPQVKKIKVKGTSKIAVYVKGAVDSKNPKKLPKIHGLFQLMNGQVQYADLPQSIDNINADIAFTTQSLHVKKMSLNLGKNPFSLVVKVDGFKKPKIDALLKASLRLEEIRKAVKLPKNIKVEMKGLAQLSVSVKGTIDPKNPKQLPAVKGSISMKDVQFKYNDLPQSVHGLNSKITFTEKDLNIQQLRMNIGNNPLSLTAKVKDFKNPVVDAHLKLDLKLGELKDAIKLPKGVSIAGSIQADIQASGKVDPKNPTAIQVKGNLGLVRVVAQTPALKKPIQLDGQFLFSNQEVNLKKLIGKIGKSSFTMNLKIRDYLSQVFPAQFKKRTQVTFALNSPLLDMNEILASSSSDSSVKSVKVSKTTTKAPSSKVIKVPKLPNVSFDGKMRIRKLIYESFPIQNSKMDMHFQNGKLKVSMFASLLRGKLVEKLNVDLSNPKRISVQNQFSATRLEANDFLARIKSMPKAKNGFLDKLSSLDNTVYGKLNLIANMRTHGITEKQLKDNMTATLDTKLYSGKLKNASLLANLTKPLPAAVRKFLPNLSNLRLSKPLQMKMEIIRGKIHVKDVNIPTSQVGLSGNGTISLSNIMDMKWDIALSKSLSRKILQQQQRLQKAGKGLLGNIGGGAVGKQLTGVLGKAMDKVRLIPSTKSGQVVPIIGMLGKSLNPLYKFIGFKGDAASTSDNGSNGKSLDVKKAFNDQVNNAKKKAQQALDDAKKKALQAADDAKKKALQAADDAKKKALQAADDAKKKALKAAQDQARKLREEAEKKKKEVEQKAKDLLKKW